MMEKYLLERFGYSEPIFISELSVPGMSENAIRQAIKRLVSSEFLKRYDTGIYYIPKKSELLGTSYLDPYVVIARKYIRDDTGTYGYITGASFANQLGLTSQVPAVLEIVTNKESTKGRMVTIGGQAMHIKRSALPINNDNASILQFLDTVSHAEKYSELDRAQMVDRLKAYLRKCQFTQKQLSDVAVVLTGSTAKKLIEWGMIYEFAS